MHYAYMKIPTQTIPDVGDYLGEVVGTLVYGVSDMLRPSVMITRPDTGVLFQHSTKEILVFNEEQHRTLQDDPERT